MVPTRSSASPQCPPPAPVGQVSGSRSSSPCQPGRLAGQAAGPECASWTRGTGALFFPTPFPPPGTVPPCSPSSHLAGHQSCPHAAAGTTCPHRCQTVASSLPEPHMHTDPALGCRTGAGGCIQPQRTRGSHSDSRVGTGVLQNRAAQPWGRAGGQGVNCAASPATHAGCQHRGPGAHL